ncbi:hypothetical protein IJ472_06650 [bacterium]|nr:hypothetical protein [bacterium]
MALVNIISAIGNNNTPYPLLIRDCGIENPIKVMIARRENAKESKEISNEATRERIIDEYATSAVWLGGIPLTEAVYDKFMKKQGWSPDINLNLFKEEEIINKRNAKKAVGEIKDIVAQGIEYNIEKFKNIQAKDVQEALADLTKVKNNRLGYEKMLTGKFCAATIIPTIVMGFVLPKMNFALTRKLRAKKAQDQQNLNNNKTNQTSFMSLNYDKFDSFDLQQKKQVTFTGGFASAVANLSTVNKMAITDGGLTVGRITTSRNKEEGYMNAFRMIGSMIINYVTPAYIALGLNKTANKLFKINVDLDPIILDDQKFAQAIENNNFELPKSKTAQDIIEFLDNKPDSLFSQYAAKMKKVSYLESGYRDPRKYIDIDDMSKFIDEFESFIKNAKNSTDIAKFAKKAKGVKYFNILANVGLSSFLLAGVLPKAQYLFNKAVTGSYLDPGLRKK